MRSTRFALVCAVAVVVGACAKSPVKPSGSSTVTTPLLTSPANGASIPNSSQPITLTVENAFVTGAAEGVTYTFEIASDTTFAAVVQSKDVAQGASRTSVTLDALAPGRDYYWRVRTKNDDTVGVFTSPLLFKVGAAVTLQAPSPVTPAANDLVQPLGTFTVTNAGRSGPTGPITYKF